MEVPNTFKVDQTRVFFDSQRVECDEIQLVSTGVRFNRVAITAKSSRFNITIPPTDIKQAYFDCYTSDKLSTLIIQTAPDSGGKICAALNIVESPENPENLKDKSIYIFLQFNADHGPEYIGVEIFKSLEDYFSIFAGIDWKLQTVDPKIVNNFFSYLNKDPDHPQSPDLEICAIKENEEKKTRSILIKSKRTYSSLSPSPMNSSCLKSSSPKQSSSWIKSKNNVLRPKSSETPSIIDIEADDDEDNTENQRSLNGSRSGSDDHLFSYPPDEIDRISIHKSDLGCLEECQYLNDTILGFYLKYIERELAEPPIISRTYIFSTFFFHKLTHRPRASEPHANDVQSVADRYYNRVKNWTKNINIFDKDFLVIPINKCSHWFLAIVCYPRRVPASDEVLPIELEKNPKRPCILFMDSLQSAHSRCGLAAPIRHFLSKEWESKKNTKKNFSRHVMPDIYLKVPKQSNAYDCGLYVIQYVENFLRNPDYLLEKTCTQSSLEDWFSVSLVASKRRSIKRLIKQFREAEEKGKNGNSGDEMMETDS